MSDNEVEPDTDTDNDEPSQPTKTKKTRVVAPDDIGTCMMDTVKKINFKHVGFIFVLFLLVTSTTFIEGILSKRADCVSGIIPTLKGTVVQGLCLVLGYIVIDILITANLI
jgi:hypothetical protein